MVGCGKLSFAEEADQPRVFFTVRNCLDEQPAFEGGRDGVEAERFIDVGLNALYKRASAELGRIKARNLNGVTWLS